MPVKDLFAPFFGNCFLERHKSLTLLCADLTDDDILVCAILVYAVYHVYVIKRHSTGANCKVFSSLFIEHANMVAFNDKKIAPVWLRALKSRTVPSPSGGN